MRPLLLSLLTLLAVAPAAAQQRIAYIDSEAVLDQITEYRTVQANLDRLAQQWQAELNQIQQQVDALVRDFEARELLFTEAERDRKRAEITAKEQELDSKRTQRFGPEGELFREQQRQMRPVQERVLAAIEEVAEAEDYDYVFDKSGDFLFLFAKPDLNISDLVLEELGIEAGRGGS
ncbi:MAG: OmpH family outer membrane protein [Rhodothermales bacterium]